MDGLPTYARASGDYAMTDSLETLQEIIGGNEAQRLY